MLRQEARISISGGEEKELGDPLRNRQEDLAASVLGLRIIGSAFRREDDSGEEDGDDGVNIVERLSNLNFIMLLWICTKLEMAELAETKRKGEMGEGS